MTTLSEFYDLVLELAGEIETYRQKVDSNHPVAWTDLIRLRDRLNHVSLDETIAPRYRKMCAAAYTEIRLACNIYRPAKTFQVDGIIVETVSLKDRPDESASDVALLDDDTPVELVGRTEEKMWLQVLTPAGDTGWIQNSCIQTDRNIDDLPISWVNEQTEKALEPDQIQLTQALSDKPTVAPATNIPTYVLNPDSQLLDDEDGLFTTVYNQPETLATDYPSIDILYEQYKRPEDNPGLIYQPVGHDDETLDADKTIEEAADDDAADDIVVEIELPTSITDDEILSVLDENDSVIEQQQTEADKLAAYTTIWFGSNKALRLHQRKLQRLFPNDFDIEWQNPDQFHITLTYSPLVTDEQLVAIRKHLPAYIDPLTIEVDGWGTFAKEDQVVFFLNVKPSDALRNLQQYLNVAFGAHGVPMSPFSDPAVYTPHITIGYAPVGYQLPENLKARLALQPDKVFIGRGNYQICQEIPMLDWRTFTHDHNEPADGSDKIYWGELEKQEDAAWWDRNKRSYQDTPQDELRAWERKTLNNGVAKSMQFETRYLPPAVKSFIMNNLISGMSKDEIRSLFNQAKDQLYAISG